MNRIISLFLLSLLSWVTATLLPAQTASPSKTASSRFLLVVDTSFSMAAQKAVLCVTAHDLIYSGIGNQMKPRDTFSVWTFNQDTDTQQFPLLEWNPDLKLILANQVSAFLNNQPFQKISRLDKALPEILGLTRDSGKLTVLILSDGLEFFQGTPFDVRINEVYRERSRELRQAGRPFITVLQAMDGQIVGWSVSAAGEPLQISQLPVSARSLPVNSEPPPDRLGSDSGGFNSGPAQAGSAAAPRPDVTKPNLIVRTVRPKDAGSLSSSPAADEKAGAFAGSSERTKLQLRVPPQSVEPDSSRLNLDLARPIALTRPADSTVLLNRSARPIEAPSATGAIAITAPVPAQSVAVKSENIAPALPETVSAPTATPPESSLARLESFQASPELVSAATPPSPVPAPNPAQGAKAAEPRIGPPTEIQAPVTPPPSTTSSPKRPPTQPSLAATPGPQTSAKPQQSNGESPPASADAPAQGDHSSLGKIKPEPAVEKSILETSRPLPNVPSAANGKTQERMPSSTSSTAAQIALVAPRASSQFHWVYVGLGLASLLTALALIYIVARRTRAPQRSSLISRSIERK